MNPLELRPEMLADSSDPAAVLAALKPLATLEPEPAESLLYALGFWLAQTMSRAADLEEVLLLDELCALAAQRAHPPPAGFHATLQAWRRLLEYKRLSIEARAGARGSHLLQADAVITTLANGEITQLKLAKHLGLSAGRVSQVLAVMEQQRLITRRRQGRESLVSLAGDTPSRATTSAPTKNAGGGKLFQNVFARQPSR